MQLKESIGSLTAVERAMQANLKLVPAPSYAMSRALELFELRSPHAEILERLNETRTTLDRLYSTSHAIEHLALKNPIHDMIERFTWPHRAFEAMATHSLAMTRMLETANRPFMELMSGVDMKLGALHSLTARLEAPFAGVTKLLSTSRCLLGGIDLDALTARFATIPRLPHIVLGGIDAVTRKYGQMLDDSSDAIAEVSISPSLDTMTASWEVLRQAKFAHLVARANAGRTEAIEDVETLEESEVGSTRDDRRLRIASLNRDLVRLIDGARDAARSDNPDRVRHAATSIRELFTHVTHNLATDEEVIKWAASDAQLVENGRPTRRGRLLFILRRVNNGAFTEFVDAEVNAMLTLIGVLHGGTHGVVPNLSDDALSAGVDWMESALANLIRIAREE